MNMTTPLPECLSRICVRSDSSSNKSFRRLHYFINVVFVLFNNIITLSKDEKDQLFLTCYNYYSLVKYILCLEQADNNLYLVNKL